MAATLRDRPIFKGLGNVGTIDTIRWRCKVPIGASGATGTLAFGPNGIAVAKNTTGVYDVTGMPPLPTGKGSFHFGIYSPAGTVGSCFVTAYSLSAGTMTFTTAVGVTATEPASGDEITIFFAGEPR